MNADSVQFDVSLLDVDPPPRAFNADCVGVEVYAGTIEIHFGMRKRKRLASAITIQMPQSFFSEVTKMLAPEGFRLSIKKSLEQIGVYGDELIDEFRLNPVELDDILPDRYMKYSAQIFFMAVGGGASIEWHSLSPSTMQRFQLGHRAKPEIDPVITILCSVPTLSTLISQLDAIRETLEAKALAVVKEVITND